MVKGLLVMAFVCLASFGYSQETGLVIQRAMEPGYRQKRLLEASATISPSTMLSRKSNNFYLTGFAEYHLNHDQFSNWDVTLGFQPGITIMSKGNYLGIDPIVELEPSRNVVSPSFALSVGAKFYVWK